MIQQSLYDETTMVPTRLTCFIPGKPEPQGSTKAFAIQRSPGKWGAVTTSDNPRLKNWRALAVCVMQDAITGDKRPAFTGPVSVRAEFIMPRLSSHPKTRSGKPAGYHTSAPDCDKLMRALGDALTVANVVEDDSRIVKWDSVKRFADLGEAAGVVVIVEPMPPRG